MTRAMPELNGCLAPPCVICTFLSATVSHDYSDNGPIKIDAYIITLDVYMRKQLQAINNGGLTALKGFERHGTKPTANACHP